MTINNIGCPGKTCHLNHVATSCGNWRRRVICVYAAESCSCLAASQPCVTTLDGKARIFQCVLWRESGHCLLPGKAGSGMSVTKQQVTQVSLVKSDVSRVKELYSGDDGERLRRLSARTAKSGIHGSHWMNGIPPALHFPCI